VEIRYSFLSDVCLHVLATIGDAVVGAPHALVHVARPLPLPGLPVARLASRGRRDVAAERFRAAARDCAERASLSYAPHRLRRAAALRPRAR
jgi:hypothetical protein